MNRPLLLLLLGISHALYGQTDLLKKYNTADSLLQADQPKQAYTFFKEIEPQCDPNDTLYSYIVWYYTVATTALEQQSRMREQFDSSLSYGLEALELIKKGKPFFDERFAAREYWMIKNIIVSCFGLDQLDKAKEYRDLLYKAYKEKKLPQGLDKYFNFSYFKWQDKNIWGYEWYPELGDPETSGSFTKILYYVYSTKPDGTDDQQLYRLHVLKFHKMDDSVKFDYVLTKRLETAKNEVSGTLYAYTYTKQIDYAKLQKDIREVLKGNLQPDTQTIINKN